MGALANFFSEKPRCYSRQTTAMLTDFAGLAVILFLASPESRAVTGALVPVTGRV